MALPAALSEDFGSSTKSELDESTLDACRAGDPAALRRFVVRYQPIVFAYLSRVLGHGPHVEDIAQEVLLRAIRALPRFDAGGTARLSTWVLTITARAAIDARRRRRETLALSNQEDEGPSDSRTPETER